MLGLFFWLVAIGLILPWWLVSWFDRLHAMSTLFAGIVLLFEWFLMFSPRIGGLRHVKVACCWVGLCFCEILCSVSVHVETCCLWVWSCVCVGVGG